MNLASLETFLAIVDTGSLVRASEKLHVSQSTVTTRLQALEREIGSPLATRQKSGIELTEAGRRFRHHATVMIELWSQAQRDVARPSTIDAVCSIGCHGDLWTGPGRRLFDAITSTHPNAAVTVLPAYHAELERLLRGGLVDIAVTYEVAVHHNQTIRSLVPDQLILVSDRADSPMRWDPGYVYVESGEDFRRRHAAAYADADTANLSFGSAQWALEELLTNGGSAYLPERMVTHHLDTGRLHRISDAPEFTRNAYLVITERASTWSWLEDVLDALDL